MRTLIKVFCLTSILILIASARSDGNAANSLEDRMFDEYGNICWDDEKARLDNFAIQLQNDPKLDGYIIVYAGRRSCEDEAKFRGERAKKWVVKRGVEKYRVIVIDGGYREDVTTVLQPVPGGKGHPITPTLNSSEVEIFTYCKGKIYDPPKCDEP